VKKKLSIQMIVIGGSAGSIPVINKILQGIPENFKTPIVICLHRMKNVSEGMKEVLAPNYKGLLTEPNDKDPIKQSVAYIAPANYHLLVCPENFTFCLSTEEMINYSRPSIDLTLKSMAQAYKKQLLGIIVTGANKDGAKGMKSIHHYGGITIAQDPAECQAPYMPQSAIDMNCIEHILTTEQIISFILNSCN
jgi:two-component system chemotaxis response regulator CheB